MFLRIHCYTIFKKTFCSFIHVWEVMAALMCNVNTKNRSHCTGHPSVIPHSQYFYHPSSNISNPFIGCIMKEALFAEQSPIVKAITSWLGVPEGPQDPTITRWYIIRLYCCPPVCPKDPVEGQTFSLKTPHGGRNTDRVNIQFTFTEAGRCDWSPGTFGENLINR